MKVIITKRDSFSIEFITSRKVSKRLYNFTFMM
jgi:hypothetical protein